MKLNDKVKTATIEFSIIAVYYHSNFKISWSIFSIDALQKLDADVAFRIALNVDYEGIDACRY